MVSCPTCAAVPRIHPPAAESSSEPTTDKKSKKKRKRDAEDPNAADLVSKKDKKKRKKDAESHVEPAESVPEGNSSETKPSKEKKQKKDKKSDALSESSTSTPALSAPSPSSSDIDAFLKKHEVVLHVPDGVSPVTPIISFDQLDVPAELRSAFAGFKEPTPIQACSWPPALEGRDVVGIAETGRYVPQ